jgi:hypothetical protein
MTIGDLIKCLRLFDEADEIRISCSCAEFGIGEIAAAPDGVVLTPDYEWPIQK